MANFRPGTLDRDETVLGGRIQKVSLTAPNQFINIGNTKVLQLTSDSSTASDRPFSFTRGSYPGQELTIQCVGPADGKVQLQTIAAAYIKIASTWSGSIYDQIKLIWNGIDWIESARGGGGLNGTATVPVTYEQLDQTVYTKSEYTVTSANIQNMHTTPIIIESGVAGKALLPYRWSFKRPGVTPFGGGPASCSLEYNGGATIVSLNSPDYFTGNDPVWQYVNTINYIPGNNLHALIGQSIQISSAGPAFTGGEDCIVEIIYAIQQF